MSGKNLCRFRLYTVLARPQPASNSEGVLAPYRPGVAANDLGLDRRDARLGVRTRGQVFSQLVVASKAVAWSCYSLAASTPRQWRRRGCLHAKKSIWHEPYEVKRIYFMGIMHNRHTPGRRSKDAEQLWALQPMRRGVSPLVLTRREVTYCFEQLLQMEGLLEGALDTECLSNPKNIQWSGMTVPGDGNDRHRRVNPPQFADDCAPRA